MTRVIQTWGVALAACGGLAFAIGCEKSAPESPAVQQINHPEHEVAGETCFICDASKREPNRLWCREHDRYEDRCWLCHPELEDKDRLYCGEHGLYEDECFFCHPEIAGPAVNDVEGAESAAAESAGLFCNEHGVAEAVCAICRSDQIDRLTPGDELLVRFASAQGMSKAGIEFVQADLAMSATTVHALAEVTLNQNATARITPLAPGIVLEVLADAGDHVVAGTPLVRIHSPEVASAKAALLASQIDESLREQAFERESALLERNISSRQDYEASLAALKRARVATTNARQSLANFGMTPADIDQVIANEDSSATLTVRSPFDGDIIARDAVVGELASPGDALMVVSDRTQVWLELSAPSVELARLEKGASVRVRLDAIPDQAIDGELVWIDPRMDARSRMIRARAVAPNPDGVLREGMYGEADIAITGQSRTARVPVTAVQYINEAPFVFVEQGDDLLAARRVAVATKSNEWVDLSIGVEPGERVVATGSFTALSEMLKARLGAGCVH